MRPNPRFLPGDSRAVHHGMRPPGARRFWTPKIFFAVKLIEDFKPLFLDTDYSIFHPSSGETVYSVTVSLEASDKGPEKVGLPHYGGGYGCTGVGL